MKNIAIIADYAPNFKGNFIASLLNLEDILKRENISMVYIFPEYAENL